MEDEFLWVETRGRGIAPLEINGIVFLITKTGRMDNNVERLSCVFKLSERFMKEARWQVGDRVAVALSRSGNSFALKRIPFGGYAIGVGGSTRKKKAKDTLMSGRIQMQLPTNWPFKYGDVMTFPNPSYENDLFVLKF